MDIDRLEERLKNREQQLTEMAGQLANHLQKLDKKNTKLTNLLNREKELEKKLRKKEEQLIQEHSDKEILMQRLQELEKIVQSDPPYEPAKSQAIENDDKPEPEDDGGLAKVDITEEAEQLGLGEVFKKYK